MKIGIVTFHWAVNYGAVLQAYALQDYLRGLGHDACLIDYKPYNRDHNLKNFVLNRKLPHPFQYVREALKDRLFEDFRRDYLVRTKRYGSLEELRQDPPLCDIYISGSDQVLHPRTLMRGERRPAPVYMLDFGPENILRAGYAVSFGCTAYPPEAAEVAAGSSGARGLKRNGAHPAADASIPPSSEIPAAAGPPRNRSFRGPQSIRPGGR